MERKWRELWFDRSAWSWTRLVTGLFCAALALSLILAGLNSLLGAPTGLTLSGLGTGISTGNPDADPNKQGNQGKTGSQGPQSLGQGIIPGGDLATALSEQIQFHGGPEGPALPVMQINGQTGTAYLRVGVPQSYPNTETRAPNQPYEGEELRHQVNAASKSTKTITVDPVSRSTQLSTPLYTTHVSSSTNGLTYSPEMQTFRSESGQSEPYQVSFDLYRYGETLLSSARTARRPVYTQLSSGITARTQALAQQITAGADTPYELARRLEQYLETNYSYDFEFQGPPPGRDPVDWFLFDEKCGVCGNFNSAFVVMARSLGLPARIVTGYRIDPSQQNQLVTTAQAHAYSEVLFDKLGWVTFDATGSYRKPPIATHISIAKAPESLVAGETAQIEGLVTGGEGQPLDKVGVTISLRSDHSEKLIGQGITKDGKFLIDALVPQDFVPGDYALAATVLPSTSRQGSADSLTRPVFAHTEIRLEPLPTTRSLKLPLSGQLLQQGTEHSLGHQQMAATLATKEPLTQTQVTAEDGRFATEIKFEPSAIPGELPTKLKYKVSFPGQGHYLPSEAEGEITIPQSGDRVIPDQSPDAENTAQQPLRPWWTNALVVVGLLALLIIAWLARHHLASLLRRHKIRPTSPEPLTPGPSPGITIDFPEIEPDLPLVWGIDEPILIRVHTVSGEPPAAPLELVADAGYPYQVSSASVDHTACFASIGEHTFYLRSNGRQVASRTIKIVSYRDEIIEGGQKLYQASGGDEAHLNGRLTPREFAQLVLAKGRELPALLTRAFVDLFEQATYSLEPISRRHYIQFYRACNAILNGPQPTTQSPQ